MLEVNKMFFFSWSFRWVIIATKGGEACASSSTLEPVLGLLLLEWLRWVQSRSAMQTWYGSFLPFARLLSPFYLIYHKLSRISAHIISSPISSPYLLQTPFCLSVLHGKSGCFRHVRCHRHLYHVLVAPDASFFSFQTKGWMYFVSQKVCRTDCIWSDGS